MSQITRCPACSTAFRVVADQLRISQGWVRCGQCQQVFDASAHLLTLAAPLAGNGVQQAATAPQQPVPAQRPQPAGRANAPRATHGLPFATAPAPAVPAFLAAGAAPGLEIEAPFSLPGAGSRNGLQGSAQALAAPGFGLGLKGPGAGPADGQAHPAAAPANQLPSPGRPAAHPSQRIRLHGAADWSDEDSSATTILQTRPRLPLRQRRSAPAPALALATRQAPPGFVLAAQRKAFWRRRAVRVVLAGLVLLLLLVLALQVVLHERDRIAATNAQARPWLARLCQPLGCEIAPQRQIADLVIDSSSFNKARGDGYLLGLTVKNRAAIALAMPAIELTLTDLQDQPVLRRVLLPAELSAPQELPAQGEWNGTLTVQLSAGAARVAGYRLLAFYP